LTSEAGITVPWIFSPPHNPKSGQPLWLVVLGEEEPLGARPDWLVKAIGDVPVLLVSPRNSGRCGWSDPSPFYIQRSLRCSGTRWTVAGWPTCSRRPRTFCPAGRGGSSVNIVGRGNAGVIAAYAALLEPRLAEVVVVDPPASHRAGPIFLNVLRVLDVPEVPGHVGSASVDDSHCATSAFERAEAIYRTASGKLKIEAP
jgi:hypothetical protein